MAAMTITRTAWIDDDGSGTSGTIINNAEKTTIYNQIDLLFSTGGAHQFSTAGAGVNSLEAVNTTSGAAAAAYVGATAGTTVAQIHAWSQGFTSAGANIAGGATFYNNGAGGMSFNTDHGALTDGSARWYIQAVEKMRLWSSGSLGIGDTSNANMTVGLTINQGVADDQILTFKSSDVAHGITAVTETDTYGSFKKAQAASGGIEVSGYTEASIGIVLRSVVTSEDATHNAGGIAPFYFDAFLKSGTGIASMSANQNIFAVGHNGSMKFLVDTDGDTFQDGTAGTAYSDWDDPMLALAVEHHINPKTKVRKLFNQYCQYNKSSLVAAGLVAPDVNGKPGFVNMSAMTRLAVGGVWQIGLKMRAMADELTTLTAQNTALQRQVRRLERRHA